jgi:hypothetical protein
MTGLSRVQITRLIACYTAGEWVRETVYRRRRFTQPKRGPATWRIPEREFEVYKRPVYARLATISVAHLYNLRHH